MQYLVGVAAKRDRELSGSKDVDVLVLGYGNALCGDDGLGQRVATLLAQEMPPALANFTTIRALHQLDLTLASQLQNYSAVIFIDAQTQLYQTKVHISELERKQDPATTVTKPMGFSAHFLNPQDLLSLAENLYQTCPTAWLVAVRGYQMEIGTELSPQAEENANQAVAEVLKLLNKLRSER